MESPYLISSHNLLFDLSIHSMVYPVALEDIRIMHPIWTASEVAKQLT